MKRISAIIAIALAGCAVQPPIDSAIVQAANAPLVCQNKAQCDLYMSRAQYLIARVSGFKIQTANDTLIETYGPTDADGMVYVLAYRVTKLENENGSADIHIDAMSNCSNNELDIGYCQQASIKAVALMKGFIRTGH